MYFPLRALIVGASAVAFSAVIFGYARAGGGHYFPPAADAVVQQECGSCHLAYSAAMLPAASWQRLMAGLNQHFGDNASLDAAAAERIGRYLAANAADAGGSAYGAKLTRGLAPFSAPLRITELPNWVREHRKVSAAEWAQAEVRTRSNCGACHTAAGQGYFAD